MKLRNIAHARAGDKGNISNISVIAYNADQYPFLVQFLTADRVKEYFSDFVKGRVERYEMPGISALNFVLYDALSGGVTRSVSLDTHGKCLSSALLNMDID